jgi:hypothetical protein
MDSEEYQRLLERNRRLSRHLPPGFDPYAQPGTYTREYYVPNVVSLMQRVAYACLAVALVLYGAVGVLTDALWIPGRRTSGVVLAGIPAWLAMASLCIGALGLLSVVVDHYDRRNNEQKYRRFQDASCVLSVGCLVVAGGWHTWPYIMRVFGVFSSAV